MELALDEDCFLKHFGVVCIFYNGKIQLRHCFYIKRTVKIGIFNWDFDASSGNHKEIYWWEKWSKYLLEKVNQAEKTNLM